MSSLLTDLSTPHGRAAGTLGVGLSTLPSSDFDPRNVAGAGVKLWLRGGLGVPFSGPNATGWNDQSGNGNNYTAVGTLPYNASSINGRPGITLGGGGTAHLVCANSILLAGNARSIYVVFKATTVDGGPLFENRITADMSSYFVNGPAFPTFPNGLYTNGSDASRNASFTPPALNGVPHIATFKCATAIAFLAASIDGASQVVTQTNGCNAETGAAGSTIGFWTFSGTSIVGDIDEVIVCDSVLSAPNDAAMIAGLKGWYTIP